MYLGSQGRSSTDFATGHPHEHLHNLTGVEFGRHFGDAFPNSAMQRDKERERTEGLRHIMLCCATTHSLSQVGSQVSQVLSI